MTTACLAPATADARDAADQLLGAEAAVGATAFATAREALEHVAAGDASAAVVAFEDSHDGTDVATLDALVFDVADLVVTAEVDVVRDGRTTRWVVVRPTSDAPRPPDDVPVQTLFFVVPHLNRPGVLTEMLAAFSSRGINVGRFDPRPLHGSLGMYGFLLEVDGQPGQPWFAEAVADLLAATSTVTHLGTLATGERAWSAVSGRMPAGPAMQDRDDLARLVTRWTPEGTGVDPDPGEPATAGPGDGTDPS